MSVATADDIHAPAAGRNIIGPCLFMAVFLFYWVTTNPYVDLRGTAVLDPSAGSSSSINQIVTIGLTLSLMAYGFMHPMRSIILQPRVLLASLFTWFFVTAFLSNYPMQSAKTIVLAILTVMNASIFLLLPASERQFGKLVAIGTLIMLGFAYFGVIFKPQLAIHQASELREPMNAGFWRGHFTHKNAAAGAMVMAAFFGFFVMRVWSRFLGLLIIGLAWFFLLHTGGKTASAMLPAVLVISWFFERYRALRIPIALGGVAAFNLLAVGSAVIPPFRALVNSFGVDPTFTNRADIWRFAFTAIEDNPILGYGMKAFWQTRELVYSNNSIETWAVEAYNAHNSFIDIWLLTGLPGLIMTLFFVLFMPLKALMRKDGVPEAQSHITRLFVRVWLYTLYNAGLESVFFDSGSYQWFSFCVALYAFRLQKVDLVTDAAPKHGASAHV
ncbi:O-antigen ligase [Rhizobium sp. NFR07]|uniref:O-antigen ligase family protein n=1 Tax=Rhizobium sp. NFR07 TaxID=1566262 RepID=UPI0008F0E1FC|nr:O-antigen ligase [Rhizobium sp. NFR07]SFB17760.1 O-antigen ligase [Rhizobium sp. NFR07]